MAAIKAFLLTDVVDSTRLAEQHGDDAMAEIWAAHDRLARDLLAGGTGREIDKTDGMLLLFESARDAVAFALAYHRGLAALPAGIAARVGVHVGPAILRENAAEDIARGAKPLEVEGIAKPIAARIMAIARGGQTLLSATARESLEAGAHALVSHGHWRLKGVTDPVELYEVGELLEAESAAEGWRFAPPFGGEKAHRVVSMGDWWLPVHEIPHNLPHQATSFVGREREQREVKAHLGSSRLVTLLGMGGLGKTRLSLEVAAAELHAFPDGVWFVDLAPLGDPALVVGEAAQLLGVRAEPGRPLLQTLAAHLKARRVLLVLDNCEHVLQAAAQLARAILQAAPGVRILATSREPLRTPGEQAVPVLPLPVPKRGDDLAALARSTAVRLFVERARAHKPAFALTEREAPAVAELVARLEGIPLAIELAAARVRMLSVAEINTRLRDRYKLLTGGSRVLQERQQTLRALVDWSYELLDPAEQMLLDRLGVFVGGFDLEAAEAVCGTDPLEPDDVLDRLGSLVEKSLVTVEEGEATRYVQLETIREYARAKLALRDGDGFAATSARHCEHYFVLAKRARRGLAGPEQAEWLRVLEDEHDNVRAAIALALADGVDPFLAVKFAVALQGFWILHGHAREGRRTIREALALPAIQADARAESFALYVGAALANSQGDHGEARAMLERCLALRRVLAHPVDIAATLSTLSLARMQLGDPAGASAAEHEALALFRAAGDRIGEAIGLVHLGQLALHEGDDAASLGHVEQALAVAQAIRHPELEGECELVLGDLAVAAGEGLAARTRYRRSLAICREAGDRRGEANALHRIGRIELADGELAAAGPRLAEALAAFRALEMPVELVACLEDHARAADAMRRPETALALAAMVARSRERLGVVPAVRDAASSEALVSALRAALAPADAARAWHAGEGWSTDEAIAAALAGHEALPAP